MTRKQRQQLLAKFHQSQLTRSDFAAQHGVGLSTLSERLRLMGNKTRCKSRELGETVAMR
jgi:hypothetical protein